RPLRGSRRGRPHGDRAGVGADDRDRGGPAHRRAGAGLHRPVGPRFRAVPQVRAQVRGVRRTRRRCHVHLRGRRPLGGVPRRSGELPPARRRRPGAGGPAFRRLSLLLAAALAACVVASDDPGPLPSVTVSSVTVEPPTEATDPPATTGEIDAGDLVDPEVISVTIDGRVLLVALADTPQTRYRGLMGVENLGDLDGMLFD